MLSSVLLAPSAVGNSSSDPYQPKPFVELTHPEWVKNANIYEVNIRQYTKEGTFKAFEAHLPRLKKLGVDILWLMPIHPIGEKNRKGEKGSYYAVKDYRKVNPEFGTLEDLKGLVNKAHKMGMYVILDWVANHSAWDNPLTETHPDWYTKNHKGNFQPTLWWDWSDIIDFDYSNPAMRQYMTESLVYWVKEANIDGYRADVAGFIPTDFWDNARAELEKIKPVFMLAEWDERDLHKNAFDMSYNWALHDALVEVNRGHLDGEGMYLHFAHAQSAWPLDAIKMNFVDNHDKNSWEDSVFKRMGPYLDAGIVLTVAAEGMPLLYSGQEAGLNRSLAFFEKDEIPWQAHPVGELYQKLFKLKHENKALWNGKWGGKMIPVVNSAPKHVVSFYREKAGDAVLAVFNFSAKERVISFEDSIQLGVYQDFNSGEQVKMTASSQLKLAPYGYQLLTR